MGAPAPSTGLPWEGTVTSGQACEGHEHLREAPLPAHALPSGPLATPQNKLLNATVSVSCESRPFQNWRMSPLLRLSQKS